MDDSIMGQYRRSKERAMQDRLESLEQDNKAKDAIILKQRNELDDHEDRVQRLEERMDSMRMWAKDLNSLMGSKSNAG